MFFKIFFNCCKRVTTFHNSKEGDGSSLPDPFNIIYINIYHHSKRFVQWTFRLLDKWALGLTGILTNSSAVFSIIKLLARLFTLFTIPTYLNIHHPQRKKGNFDYEIFFYYLFMNKKFSENFHTKIFTRKFSSI